MLKRGSLSFRAIGLSLAIVFLSSILLSDFSSLSYAQVAAEAPSALAGLSLASDLNLPSPNKLIELSPSYQPISLRGLRFYPDDPLRLDFILDDGYVKPDQLKLKSEASVLIKYFLSSLTIPEEDLWVNLSPYEADKVVPEELGLTEMGKDLLAQDYLLKQLMASLTYPENPLGKGFWDKVYQQAHQLFGTSKIPINTFNKVWIVPDKAVVYEDKDRVILGEAKLKVMLEEDYQAFKNRPQSTDHSPQKKIILTENDEKNINNFSSSIMKEIILPAIEKEVNEGKNFSQLRQIYHSLILATWFKQKLKESIVHSQQSTDKSQPLLTKIYIDKKKIKGIDSDDPKVKEKVYQLYIEAYKNGLYNYIKKDFDPYEKKQIKRRYYSGGANFAEASSAITALPISQMSDSALPSSSSLSIRLMPSGSTADQEEVSAALPLKQLPPETAASSAMRISYEDLVAVPDTESRARLIIDEMKTKHGKPYETKTIDIEGKKIEVINWFRTLGAEEWQAIQDVLGKFRSIAGGKLLEEIYYLAIEPSDSPNPNAPDENLNGWGAVNGVFKLFPNAFNQKGHRVRGVPNLTGTLIHELGHTAADTLVNTWREKFTENNNHIAYITSYAKTNAKEDIAETMIAAILGIDYSLQVIVQEKINFLQKILEINPKQPLCLTPDSLIYLADGSTKSLIALKPFTNPRGAGGGAQGDMVLSLNEQTGRLEPHRVMALLDMGVKPVYRIITQSGKSLKTTLTHPYLTREGWRNLEEIKVGEEVAVAKRSSSAVGIFPRIDSVNNNVQAFKIETNTVLSDPEPMRSGRKVNQGPGKRQGVAAGDIQSDFLDDTFLQLERELSEFSFAGRSKLKSFNHTANQASPSSCLIFSKDTKPNFLASSMPFLSLKTNLGLIGKCVSMVSINHPNGLWKTYSWDETFSSNLLSKAQSRSHKEYVSNTKYLGDPFLSTTARALKFLAEICFLSSTGIAENFSNSSNFTGSFVDNLVNDLDFIPFSPFSATKYSTPILKLSRLFSLCEAEAAENTFASPSSDILWDKIISIEPLGPMQVYDIEVEATHNFIAEGIVAHNTYSQNEQGVSSSVGDTKGGIDLNPQNLEMEIKGAGTSPVFMNNISLDLQNFQGFSFQIISIQPVKEGDVVFS